MDAPRHPVEETVYMETQKLTNQSWFSMPVNLALGKLRQGNDKFEIGYIASSRPS